MVKYLIEYFVIQASEANIHMQYHMPMVTKLIYVKIYQLFPVNSKVRFKAIFRFYPIFVCLGASHNLKNILTCLLATISLSARQYKWGYLFVKHPLGRIIDFKSTFQTKIEENSGTTSYLRKSIWSTDDLRL